MNLTQKKWYKSAALSVYTSEPATQSNQRRYNKHLLYQHKWNLNITIEIEQYGIEVFKEINVAKISTPE